MAAQLAVHLRSWSYTERKVHIAYGLRALKIDPEQIIREVR
jgi:hypothetical protein